MHICRRLFVISLLMTLTAYYVNAQCCAAGNPVGGDGSQEGLRKHEMRVFAAYRLSYSRDYYHHSKKEDIQHIDKSYYNYSSLSVTYGLNWRFTMHAEMGYFFDKVQVINLSSGQETIESHGLGDLSLTGRYSLLPQKLINEDQFILSLGGRFPVGAFNQEMEGVVIPVSLQPSSGALKINSGLYYSHKKKDALFGWSAFTLFEWSKEIDKDFLIYKYGNFFMLEATAFYSETPKFTAFLSAKAEYRQRDSRENDLEIESTGGLTLYLRPQLQFAIGKSWSLVSFADVPVYKYVNGYQLTNLFAMQVGLRKSFLL